MKVILLEDIKALGKKGDIKEVAEGYARNFLIPQKKVVEANEASRRLLQQTQEKLAAREASKLAEAREIAGKLQNKLVVVKAKAGTGTRLFGAVTNKEVAEALSALVGQTLERRKVELTAPIKTLGEHEALLRLHPDVSVNVKIKVEAL